MKSENDMMAKKEQEMNEIPLGAFSVGFDLKNISKKEDYVRICFKELEYKSRDLITKPGLYALKVIVCEIENDEETNNE